MENKLPLLFEKGVYLLLQKMCNANETIQEKAENRRFVFDFYTKTGIFALGIKENTFIETKYIKNNSAEYFRRVVDWIWQIRELLGNANIVIIVNISSRALTTFLKLQHRNVFNNIRIISIDELGEKENQTKKEKNDGAPPIIKTFKKCIPAEKLEEILYNEIRLKVLSSVLPNQVFSVDKIIIKNGQLFPFGYEDIFGKYHVFLKSHSTFTDKNIIYRQDAIKHRIDFVDGEYETSTIVIDGFREEFPKLGKDEFLQLFPVSIFYEGYSIIPENLQFKYRSFWKENKKTSFDEKDIRNGSKGALVDNTIYFSGKTELNDPFDLDADNSAYGIISSKHDYRVFCVSERPDNVLLWSHYGDSHKGMATSYLPTEILDKLEVDKRIGFSVYGLVNYSNIRKPLLRNAELIKKVVDSDLLDLMLQLLSLFRKFKDWEYEREFRYIVCLTDEVGKMTIKVRPRDFYFGQAFKFDDDLKRFLFKHIGRSCYSFKLSKTRYHLLPFEVMLP